MIFTRRALETAGFLGWVPFAQVRTCDCPVRGGVYVVVSRAESLTTFKTKSCAGWFKGRDPSVAADVLAANWVEDAEVVYIGKAENLKRRLTQFADFGAGKPIGHWGGRLIWQLAHIDALRVAWMETHGRSPVEVEAELIAEFRQTYEKPPFANEPHRLGR